MEVDKDLNPLPQLRGGLFLTDGGIETTLIFREGLELPSFAAFVLLDSEEGTQALRRYFRTYAEIAAAQGTGLVLESATWRANPDWGSQLGYTAKALAEVNRRAIDLLREIKAEFAHETGPIVVSGCLGPRGDGYDPAVRMSPREAESYHSAQIDALSSAGVDMVAAITMTTVEEAIGIARAAASAHLPSAISFTVETDGRLPTGETLKEAIARVDEATAGAPAYYMINCAHPTHFEEAIAPDEPWPARIRGLRANASTKSHAELNDSTALDDGDPAALGRQYAQLKRRLASLNVLGGCCGTDHRHIAEIARACGPLF